MGSVKEDLGVSVKKSEDFNEWYLQVVLRSGLAEHSPVKGFMVIKPWAYAIWEKIQQYLNKEFKKRGIENAYFPLLIPKSILSKEEEHIEGFSPEVAWVTKGGDRELEEPLAIRPTSETIIYAIYSKWVRSHRDLPLKINQWANVVRWETKATKLFLRTREFLWQEGHTVHATKEDADKMVFEMLDVYEKLARELLAIYVVKGYKSESEKFAGALYTTTIEGLMSDNKALQMGTSHNLGQHFSKAYDIKYLDENNNEQYAWQTSWGVSTRLIGALVMVHGDDYGLVLPPKVAPLQIVIVPIWFKNNKEQVIDYANKIAELFEGLDVYIDDREQYTPGYKFNEWDLKGVPIRIEVGPRDANNMQAVIYRRDERTKQTLRFDELKDYVYRLMDEIQQNLYERSKRYVEEHVFEPQTYEEFKEIIAERKGMVYAPWCGREECEMAIKEETGATTRCIPLSEYGKEVNAKCIKCGEKAKHKIYFALAY